MSTPVPQSQPYMLVRQQQVPGTLSQRQQRVATALQLEQPGLPPNTSVVVSPARYSNPYPHSYPNPVYIDPYPVFINPGPYPHAHSYPVFLHPHLRPVTQVAAHAAEGVMYGAGRLGHAAVHEVAL